MSDETPEIQDLRGKVQTWLMGEGWKLMEKNHPDMVWLVEAEDAAHRRLLVGQSKMPPDQLRIVASVTVAPSHKAQFESLPAAVRKEALWALRFRLLAMNVDFSGVGEPLERVEVARRMYLDGLGKDAFLERVSGVRNALIAVIWSIVHQLEDVPAPRSQGDAVTN